MPLIFIGYRRDDGGHARAIYLHLALWFDDRDVFLDHESLDSGEKFKPALAEAIERSALFLAVMGQHWLSEKNCARLADEEDITRGEIRAALQKGVPIIPILCGGAGVPPQDTLPADIAALCDYNAHPLPDTEYVPALNRLIDKLRGRGLQPRYRPPHGVNQACHLGDRKLSAYFTDPVDALGRLRRMFTGEGRADVLRQVTLQGMGGVGKTQLALKYSETYQDQYAGVWWFRAESLVQLQQDCQYFCAVNGVALFDGEEPHRAVDRFLRRQPRWLLVFDNADAEYGENGECLRPYLPGGDHHLIITARSSDLGDDDTTLHLDVWKEEEALPFLGKRLARASDNELRTLTRILGGLPLALEQACAYLRKTGNPITAYCDAIDDLDRSRGYLERQAAQENGYPYSILATLSISFDRLSEAAGELLRLCAWCAPEPIPDCLFRLSAGILAAAEKREMGIELNGEQQERMKKILPDELRKVAADDLLWGETVAELTGFALAQRVEVDVTPPGTEERQTEGALLLHRLTQAAVIHRLCDASVDAPSLTELVRLAFPDDLSSTAGWPLARALAPHVLRLDEHFAAGHVPHGPLSWLLNQVATYLQNGPALYDQSVVVFRRALALAEKILGPDHPGTLTSMNNLASTLRAQGDVRGARALQEKVLEIRRRVLGEEHPDTTVVAWNFFVTLCQMDEHDAAQAVINEYLSWLLAEGVELQSADQRQIREMLRPFVGEKDA